MSEQYIFRKEQRSHFTTVDNAIFDTTKLSLGAIGLACFILSNRNDWKVRIGYLSSVCKEGEKAIRALLKELAEAGYMMRVRERKKDGTLVTVTLVADYPRYIDIGTAEERINGYEYTTTDLPSNGMSVDGMAVDGMAVEGDVGRGEVITKTKETNTKKQILKETSTNVSSASQTAQQEMFGAVCEAIGWDYKTLSKEDKGQVAQAVGILGNAGYAVDDIRHFMVDIWFKDWRWEKNSQYPTLKQLRQEIGKTRSVVKSAAPAKKQTGMDAYREMLVEQGIGI